MSVQFGRSSLLLAVLATPAFAQEPAPPQSSPQPPPPAPPRPQPPASSSPDRVEGVIISAPSQASVQSRLDGHSYSLSGDLQATAGSIGDALNNLPSVDIDLQGNLSLRGDPNVTILVDGKPSGLFKGAGRAAALQQLPAGRYARVEILTNPSAAFGADGSGGIINLITKKAKGAGVTRSLQVNLGDQGAANSAASVGYNSGKLALNADISVRRDTRKVHIIDRRELMDGVESANLRQARPITYTTNAHVAADYQVSERTTLSAEGRHMQLDFSSRPTDVYVVRSPAGETRTIRGGRRTNRVYDDEVGARWVRKLAGEDHDLTLDLDHDKTINKDRQPYQYSVGAPATGAYETFNFDQRQSQTRFAVDYRKPMLKDAKMTAGALVEDDDYLYANGGLRGGDAGTAQPDPSLTNRFRYSQVISALYGTLEQPFGKMTAQLGVRLERARIRTEQLTLGGVHRQDDTRAFPSLHLDYALDDHHRLKGAYVERLERPNPDDLNPFTNRSGALIVTAGNPDLKPERTRGYEVSYEYRDGATYRMATVFFRDVRDTVTDIVTPLDDGVLLSTKANLGRRRNIGLELSAGGRLVTKLTYTVSATAIHSKISVDGLAVGEDRSAFLIGGKGALNWQATEADFLQLNAQVRAKRITPQGYRPAYGTLNLGYRHKINERLSLVATIRDVLDSAQSHEIVKQAGLYQRLDYDNTARRFTVGLTYALGGKTKKSASFDYGS